MFIFRLRSRLAAVTLIAATPAVTHAADAAPTCRSTVSGDLRLHTLESPIFGNARTVRVLLPPGYDATENANRRYPVLSLLDGQNLFDRCLSDVAGYDDRSFRFVLEPEVRHDEGAWAQRLADALTYIYGK